MTIHLPNDLESSIQAVVHTGRFASVDDAMAHAARLLLEELNRVQQQATEGDLHWLLVNGNMRKGMPSWAKLGDQQIWQVITYVKSLRE